jgi:hypothetical protein
MNTRSSQAVNVGVLEHEWMGFLIDDEVHLVHATAACFATRRIPQRPGRSAIGHAQGIAHGGLAAVVKL